jgi:hypothetical protein
MERQDCFDGNIRDWIIVSWLLTASFAVLKMNWIKDTDALEPG